MTIRQRFNRVRLRRSHRGSHPRRRPSGTLTIRQRFNRDRASRSHRRRRPHRRPRSTMAEALVGRPEGRCAWLPQAGRRRSQMLSLSEVGGAVASEVGGVEAGGCRFLLLLLPEVGGVVAGGCRFQMLLLSEVGGVEAGGCRFQMRWLSEVGGVVAGGSRFQMLRSLGLAGSRPAHSAWPPRVLAGSLASCWS